MRCYRWWDIAAAASAAVVVVLVSLDAPRGPTAWAPWAVDGGFLVLYLAVGRRNVVAQKPAPHLAMALGFAAVLALGCSVEPSMAILQGFIYPYLWVASPSTRRAIEANVLVAAGAALGYALHSGEGGVVPGVVAAGLSLGFSLALGLWITQIAKTGEERGRLLAELQAAQGELATLHRDAGVTEERARLAREIHDTIAQSLTGLVMVAQRAGNRLESVTPGASHTSVGQADDGGGSLRAAQRDVALMEDMAREALTEARGLVAALAPVGMDTTLADALARLAASFERETGVRVEVAAEATGLGREIEILLLRSAQEGIANVRKHAHAHRVVVTLASAGGAARLEVLDDGVGPGDAHPGEHGFGLSGLRDRLALAHGRLEFGPAPGGGTVLAVEVPGAGPASSDVARPAPPPAAVDQPPAPPAAVVPARALPTTVRPVGA